MWQRVAAIGSATLFLVMAMIRISQTTFIVQAAMMSGLVVFACAEKLSAIMNQIAVENDWVSWKLFNSLVAVCITVADWIGGCYR